MGSKSSKEEGEQVESAAELHSGVLPRDMQQQIKKINGNIESIKKMVNKIFSEASQMGWNSNPAEQKTICENLEYHWKIQLDKLTYPILKNEAYVIGFRDEDLKNPTPAKKEQLCYLISNFYKRKLNVANFVSQNLTKNCLDWLPNIEESYKSSITELNTLPDEHAALLKRLKEYLQVMDAYYSDVRANVTKLSKPDMTNEELTQVALSLENSMSQGYSRCCNAVNNLRNLIPWKEFQQHGQKPYYYRGNTESTFDKHEGIQLTPLVEEVPINVTTNASCKIEPNKDNFKDFEKFLNDLAPTK